MAEIHDQPQRKGDGRPEVPEGYLKPRARRLKGFAWYVKADIHSSRWRERKGQSGVEEDDGQDGTH